VQRRFVPADSFRPDSNVVSGVMKKIITYFLAASVVLAAGYYVNEKYQEHQQQLARASVAEQIATFEMLAAKSDQDYQKLRSLKASLHDWRTPAEERARILEVSQEVASRFGISVGIPKTALELSVSLEDPLQKIAKERTTYLKAAQALRKG